MGWRQGITRLSVYNFDRLSILLVEDNPYVAGVLRDVLKDVRVGDVTILSNGAEAIEHLKALKAKVLASDGWGPDLIISDFIMSPVNGLILLRWLRTSPDSPDRFMPFVMLSAAADLEHAASARDLGADEFLVKPFSATAIYKHLLNIIDHRRAFIMTSEFFGPDRRRHHSLEPKTERRVMDEADIAQISGGDKPKAPPKDRGESKVWKFEPTRRLRTRLGGRSGAVGDVPGRIVEQAEAHLNREQPQFVDWAGKYLDDLAALAEEAKAETDHVKRDEVFGRINVVAHELRGQGGVFGYPLVTTIGKMLYVATLEGHPEDDRAVEVVTCHVDSLRAVLREKITGDGGDIGRDLLRGLKASISKHLHPG